MEAQKSSLREDRRGGGDAGGGAGGDAGGVELVRESMAAAFGGQDDGCPFYAKGE